MSDRYTKTVLTIIAAALVGLLAAQLTPIARAQSEACGSIIDPCYVKFDTPVHVYVDNQPTPFPP